MAATAGPLEPKAAERPAAHFTICPQAIEPEYPHSGIFYAPRYLLRDRDTSYGQGFRDRVRIMGIEEVITAPRSPWQNPFVERVIGSIRRECLDHVIIINERHLRRVLSSYFRYYHESRTHLSLNKDCPETRPILPPTAGKILAVAQLGGLHHQYERRAA